MGRKNKQKSAAITVDLDPEVSRSNNVICAYGLVLSHGVEPGAGSDHVLAATYWPGRASQVAELGHSKRFQGTITWK
jgi:hypothetical protein